MGINLEVIARSLAPSMKLLQTSLDDLLSKVGQGDVAAYEASLDVWCHAAEGYRKISSETRQESPFLDALLVQLRSSVEAGLGPQGAAAMVGHLEGAR